MSRPIWKGQIAFGLVSVDVTMFSAIASSQGVSFNLINKKTGDRIKNVRVDEKSGKEVPWDDIVKGYPLEDGSYATFTDEELDQLEADTSKNIEILEFVPRADIPLPFYSKPYYLVPGKNAKKPFSILYQVLKKTNRAGIANVILRTKQYVSAVLPYEDTLMLYLLRYEYEVNEVPAWRGAGSKADAKVSEPEMNAATQLVESMAATWNPAKFKDEFRDRLLAWVEDKRGKGKKRPAKAKQTEEPGKVIDIMELLKASMKNVKPAPARQRKKA